MSGSTYPSLPPDETLREAAYLIARGVRPLALVGTCAASDALSTRHHLLIAGERDAIPFVLPSGDGGAKCGYASHAWVIDLLKWVDSFAPARQRHRILGLLLGYAPDEVRAFEELCTHGGDDE